MRMPSKGRGTSSGGGKRGRSAATGKFVEQSTVKRHPNTTVNESTGKKKGGK
jgi:ribosomal protein L35